MLAASCFKTISCKFKLPTANRIIISCNPIDTSYEIICAEERKAPKKAYFELLDQPAKITPYTFKEEIAKIAKIPKFKFAYTTFSSNGINAHKNKLNNNVKIGANVNNKLLAFDGVKGSLINNFKASANGCRKPKIPTILGPLRYCNEPIIFLSSNVKKATKINIGTIKIIYFIR